MMPSLTPPSTDPLSNADCTKRNVVLPPPFGIITPHPAGTPSPPSSTATTPTPTPTPTTPTTESAVNDASINKIRTKTMNCTLVACPWTGAPIRAIIPLPRRKLGANDVQDNTITTPSPSPSPSGVHGCSLLPGNIMYGPLPPCSTRSTFFDDEDVDSGDDEDDEEEEEYEGRVEGCVGRATLWCCSYESITAAEGLSAWSFEELRVECYAQSLVARGTKPPPAVQPALAIPPAFVPRSVPRN